MNLVHIYILKVTYYRSRVAASKLCEYSCNIVYNFHAMLQHANLYGIEKFPIIRTIQIFR